MLDPMAFMKDGIPLSLVVDLFDDDGPSAAAIYSDEPADVSWVHDVPVQPN